MSNGNVGFEALTPAEWFRRNREVAGFTNPTRAVYQTIRELVENALDATEPHGILPDIKIVVKMLDENKGLLSIYVEDNGIGIPEDEVPKVFGQVFYSSKYRIKQHRGIFGLGAKMVVLYAQSTSGQPVRVISASIGSSHIYSYDISIDTLRNRPQIHSHVRFENKYGWHGTGVKVTIEGNWQNAKSKVEEYVKRTAMVAPYANIVLIEPNGTMLRFSRVTTEMPKPPAEGLPHPSGIDLETLKQMILRSDDSTILTFLVENFDGVGEETAHEFLKFAGIRPDKHVKRMRDSELKELVEKMRTFDKWRRPSADWLSPIGEELLVKGIMQVLKPEAAFAVTRKPSAYMGNPFIVEAAVAWGGGIQPNDKPILFRFANKVPLLYDEGSDVIKYVLDEIDWSQYKVKFPAPIAVLVHVCSTKIPYASAGKEAIADIPEVEREVKLAVQAALRKLRAYLTRKEKEAELLTKYATLKLYSSEVVSALSYITKVSEEDLRSRLEELIEHKIGLDNLQQEAKP